MLKQFIALSLSLAFCTAGFASVETVKAKLAQQYPNVKINNLQTTEMQGLYSGTLDSQIVYVNEDAQHLFIGSMIRLKDRHTFEAYLRSIQSKFHLKMSCFYGWHKGVIFLMKFHNPITL